MVTAPLVTDNIQHGREVLDLLKQADFDVNAALWWYSPESEQWTLLIATNSVETSGPAASYRKLQEALRGEQKKGIYLTEPSISLIEPKHPLLSILRDYFAVRHDHPIRNTRINQNIINGYAIEGAYVYCL